MLIYPENHSHGLLINVKLCSGSRSVQTGLNQLPQPLSKVNNFQEIMLDLCYNVWNYNFVIMGAVDTMYTLKSTYKRGLQNNRTTLTRKVTVLLF